MGYFCQKFSDRKLKLMFNNLFRSVRQAEKRFDSLFQGDNKTFALDLFPASPWFLQKLNNKVNSIPPKKTAKELPSESEKSMVVNSLKDFIKDKSEIENRPDVKKNVKVDGGYVSVKKNETVPINTTQNIKIEKSKKVDLYQQMSNCKICEGTSKNQEHIYPLRDFEKLKDIDVLFLTDFIREDRSIFPKDQYDLVKNIIKGMKLDENKYLITSAIKCFVDKDTYERDQIDNYFLNCKNFLYQEIANLNPKFLISFGAITTKLLLGSSVRLQDVHGKFFNQTVDIVGESSVNYTIVPIFHPEMLLFNPNMKRNAWNSMKEIMVRLQNIS